LLVDSVESMMTHGLAKPKSYFVSALNVQAACS